MFAILIFERPLLTWPELGSAFLTWVRDAGGVAALALTVWCLVYVVKRLFGDVPSKHTGVHPVQAGLFVAALAIAALAYVGFFISLFVEGTIPETVTNSYGKKAETWRLTDAQNALVTIGGAFALVAVLAPIFFSLGRLRIRRIWALAKLSMKETVRNRVLWVFSFLLLVFLFASWFIPADKPEYQLANYIWVVDWFNIILLLLAASLLASFGIPGDVRSQTIHTVVTKPVERFEIVVGRFVGYTVLMTLVLIAVTGLGLLYVFRNINEEAKEENYKARVPLYGKIEFLNTQGINVGREWTHRKYISGPNRQETFPKTQYAVWYFADFPARLADRPDGVACEFGFDVYRTHKGKEGKGIFCTFMFVTRQGNRRLVALSDKTLEPDERTKTAMATRTSELANEKLSSFAIKSRVAEEFGYYVRTEEVTDYHTQSITLPPGLFQNMQKSTEGDESAGGTDEEEADPLRRAPLRVYVKVDKDSPAQLVGVAQHDLYLLDRERSFEMNYFKAAFGIWYRLCLIIGIAVSVSSYLSGIITWICAGFFFGLGVAKEFIQQLALGLTEGGGPGVSAIKMITRKVTAAELEPTPINQMAAAFDQVFSWILGHFLNVIPDVNRFGLSRYLESGFDISWLNVLLLDTLIPLVGLLVPWLILSYYLIKYREIANPS
jgi:hypothetical protein